MENKLSRAIYDQSPMLLRSIAASVNGWHKNRRRHTGDYARWRAFFRERSRWSEDRLYEFQSDRLRQWIETSVRWIPYYQRVFAERGLSSQDIREPRDLEKLPILEKSQVAHLASELLSPRLNSRSLRHYATSGSTGTPLKIPRIDSMEQMEWAFLRERFWPEDVYGRPYSSFTGLELLPAQRSRPPFWIDNWASSQRMYSIFHMSEANLCHYIDSLEERFSYAYIGYPSAIFLICDFMRRHGLRLRRPPRYVLTSSEELQPTYESTIRDVLGASIRNRYGQNELVGSITTYDCGHMHYDMDYSILEFPIVSTNEEGEHICEIIGTNLHDDAWPLLRYRTGDLVAFHPGDRCELGRPGRIIRRVHGRTGRYFTLPNGSRITNISVIAKKCTRVKLMQVVQSKLGEITVRVVRDRDFDVDDEKRILSEFRKKIGMDIVIRVDYVADIVRTPSGKFISIVNEMEIQEPNSGRRSA